MKRLFKAPVAFVLALLARMIIRKYRPLIVMVTGSVGKTSTKDAVAAALSARFHLRASEKSYNSEFGVPLTIIGAKNPWENPMAWLSVFKEALALILFPSHYPKLLVLEVGADRPGDLARILRIATPDAVVVTKLPEVPVHVEAYASPTAVREEEFTPAFALSRGAPLIVSADDPYARELAQRIPAALYTYGYESGATARLARPEPYEEQGRLAGMRAFLTLFDEKLTLNVPRVLGRPQLYAAAAALVCARALGLSTSEATEGLSRYIPPAGRARILRGLRGSTLIDDSYNASPVAVEEALDALSLVQKEGRRIAVLGDMLELGRFSREQHAHIGKSAAQHASVVVGVGARAEALVDAAAAEGKSAVTTYRFPTSQEAVQVLPALIEEGDLVLIKGSQGMRMERIVEALLENPADTSHLVRQEEEWKRR